MKAILFSDQPNNNYDNNRTVSVASGLIGKKQICTYTFTSK